MKLNLGASHDIRKGYININKIFQKGINLVCDIEKGFPFKDKYVEEVIAFHVVNMD